LAAAVEISALPGSGAPPRAEPAKVLGSPSAPGAAQAHYEALRRQHQVDLNDERNLADLEDPGLMDHMHLARRQLAGHDLELAKLPQPAELERADTDGRRSLSALALSLKEQQMALQCACDAVILEAANVGRLVEGGRLHAYPAPSAALGRDTAVAKNLEHLGKKLSSAGSELSKIAEAFSNFERALTLARRSYEAVVDGLRRRHARYEASHQELSESLRASAGGSEPPAG
jgi:hypothetical protein